tara:strand:- start:40 stop:324 length:285 start_codon:yes stop_codon:yes gene_type:complete
MSFVTFEPLLARTVAKKNNINLVYPGQPSGYTIKQGKIRRLKKIEWDKGDWDIYTKLISYLHHKNKLEEKLEWIKAAWDQAKGRDIKNFSTYLL